MQGGTLLKRRPQGPVQAILEIQLALPLHDVGEQVAVERGLLGKERCQVQGAFGGDQLSESDHPRRDVSPVPGRLKTVRRIGSPVTHRPEDHHASLGAPGARGLGVRSVALRLLAEDRGFEPLRAFTQHAFQACALGHYANPPSRRLPEGEPHPTIGSCSWFLGAPIWGLHRPLTRLEWNQTPRVVVPHRTPPGPEGSKGR